MITKTITLLVGDSEFPFCVTTADYNAYINAMTPDNKVTPSVNFVRQTLQDKEKRKELDELCDAGLAVDLAGQLLTAFRPEVEITVKK